MAEGSTAPEAAAQQAGFREIATSIGESLISIAKLAQRNPIPTEDLALYTSVLRDRGALVDRSNFTESALPSIEHAFIERLPQLGIRKRLIHQFLSSINTDRILFLTPDAYQTAVDSWTREEQTPSAGSYHARSGVIFMRNRTETNNLGLSPEMQLERTLIEELGHNFIDYAGKRKTPFLKRLVRLLRDDNQEIDYENDPNEQIAKFILHEVLTHLHPQIPIEHLMTDEARKMAQQGRELVETEGWNKVFKEDYTVN